MKRILLAIGILVLLLTGCGKRPPSADIAATTLPVYEFTTRLCAGTDITVSRVIQQSVSCLHDYTLQVSQMRLLEGARTVVISGAGLEDFLHDVLPEEAVLIDASAGIPLLEEHCYHEEGHDTHHHDTDPHIWLSPVCAKAMVQNIAEGLCQAFPESKMMIAENLWVLESDLDALLQYGQETLSTLTTRQMITFHDGFAYFAQAFDLTVLRAIEEDAGSEVSASTLKELITLVENASVPAIFTETNGSSASASIIASETNVQIFTLDMAFSDTGYFDAMYRNINTVREALG